MDKEIEQKTAIDVGLAKEATDKGNDSQFVQADIKEAYEKGYTDINFFSGLCMPTTCTTPFPLFYVAVWYILANRTPDTIGKLLRFALGLPRGHAKTTFTKILIVWLIVYDKISFPLIVGANEPLAVLILADIHDILGSPNITAIYGNWTAGLIIDNADTKKCLYHGRSVVLIARGWSAGIRGINIANQRPDMIFLDDAQTKKNDDSITERETLLRELVGTIFKAIAPAGNRYIVYLGNMYSEECVLYMLKKNKQWYNMITGAILEDKQPLWPELFSLEDLMESYEHDEGMGLADIWFAEVMNDPKSAATRLLKNPVPPSDYEQIVEPDSAFITIDPAGFRKTSDDNVIAVHLVYGKKYYIAKMIAGIQDPRALISNALTLATEYGVSLIGVEEVGYQQTLLFWFSYFMKELEISNIDVVPLKPHGRQKEARIRLFIAELYAETYFLMEPTARRAFIWQAHLYKVGKPNNKDDILDAFAYGLDVRNEYAGMLRNIRHDSRTLEGEATVLYDNTPF